MSRRILVFGGTSGIAEAIVRNLATVDDTVILGARPSAIRTEIASGLKDSGLNVSEADFDALNAREDAAALLQDGFDIAIVAFGILAEQDDLDPQSAENMSSVNYTGAVQVGFALRETIARQGSGQVIALSSAATIRPQQRNYLYGSSKAGMDFYFRGLHQDVRTLGGSVLVVRPGPVNTKMLIAIGDDSPIRKLAIEPDDLARKVVKALNRGKHVLWAPWFMGMAALILRSLPAPIYRALGL